MSDKSLEFKICAYCGSTEYLEDYPTSGITICAKCANEINKIVLREMVEDDILVQHCPFCGKEGEEGDTLFDDDNIMIFKCKGCGKLDGYRIVFEPTHTIDGQLLDRTHKPKAVSLDKLEGNQPVYSAEQARKLAKALEKAEKDPKEKCIRKLNRLVEDKSQLLKAAKVSALITDCAKTHVQKQIRLEGSCTDKQINILFAAAILEAQETLLRLNRIPKKEITERQLKKMFTIDRKTLRKWKRILRKQNSLSKLDVTPVKRESQSMTS